MSRRLIAIAIGLCAALPAIAETAYFGGVETVGTAGRTDTVRGTVFRDANRNARRDPGEAGVAGVAVSNGLDVTLTDAEGRYLLPAYDDMTVFITKPAGHAVPVDDDLVPQFFYTHKPAGSPPLRFGGLAPTGALPAEINFPLARDDSDRADFTCLFFGDTQPYTHEQVGYVRDTVGAMLAARDSGDTECLVFLGDVLGDDLTLFPRFKRIVAAGGVPQYFVPGNHDLDFDAPLDQHSFDTFRREWGPEYYSFDIGAVHFVVLDNVRYPCNGVDPHAFCAPGSAPTYNGIVHARQLAWLARDLAVVPEDRLIVLMAHISFQSFVNAGRAKHQTDNLHRLVEILGDRPVLGLSGHTHTTENLQTGEAFAGWAAHTGVPEAPFPQIVAGAVSGAWWSGNLNDAGVPESYQALGAPPGYFEIAFSGTDWVDTYRTFGAGPEKQMHAGFNTPRFRAWAARIYAYARLYDRPNDIPPPVSINDLGDPHLVTRADLTGGTWLAVNVWNGSRSSTVTATIDGRPPMTGTRTQPGDGERRLSGPDYADPVALRRQASDGRVAIRSLSGGPARDGYEMFAGERWTGTPGPLPFWMLNRGSHHLWRVDMPADLPAGMHVLRIQTTDRHGRTFSQTLPFEVVEEMPPMSWQSRFWEAGE